MPVLYTNNASATLLSAVAQSDTTIYLSSGKGALFPAPTANDFFRLTLIYGTALEIVTVTGRAGDVLTVVRGAEGTSPMAFPAGSVAELRVTAGVLDQIKADIIAYVLAAVNGGATAPTVVDGGSSSDTAPTGVYDGGTASSTQSDVLDGGIAA